MVLILWCDYFVAYFKPLATSLLVTVKCYHQVVKGQLNETSLPYGIGNFFIIISIVNTKSIVQLVWIVDMRTESTETIASARLNVKTIVTTGTLIFNSKIIVVLINFYSNGGARGSFDAFNICPNCPISFLFGQSDRF